MKKELFYFRILKKILMCTKEEERVCQQHKNNHTGMVLSTRGETVLIKSVEGISVGTGYICPKYGLWSALK